MRHAGSVITTTSGATHHVVEHPSVVLAHVESALPSTGADFVELETTETQTGQMTYVSIAQIESVRLAS